MKVQLFKKIIKEAVREVLLEEGVLTESRSTNKLPIKPPLTVPQPSQQSTLPSSGLQSILEDTRRSMTEQDYKSMIGDTVQQPVSPLESQMMDKASAIMKNLKEKGKI